LKGIGEIIGVRGVRCQVPGVRAQVEIVNSEF